jgi:lyso-ornithine lipid O-acyltransferase
MASGSIAAADRRAAVAQGYPERIGIAGWLRMLGRIVVLVLALITLVPVHYGWSALRYGSPIPMLYLRFACRVVGARVQLGGTPLRRDVFFVANHVSWVDILAMAGQSGTAFVAKSELATIPVVGWLARLNRTVFVSRENRAGVAGQIKQLREALADNWSVTVFPEGTTTDGQSLLPFKTALLRVLEPPPPGIQVQPVLLDYGAIAEWIGWVGIEGGLDNAKRILARKGSFRLGVQFLEPFDPQPHPNRKAIAAECRSRIEAALIAALGKPLRPFAYEVAAVRYAGSEAPGLDSGTEQV